MGILNRTPDSFYDQGATYELDKLYARAEQLVADGADILDVGGVKAGPGPEVTEPEELDRVVPVGRRPDRALRHTGLRRHMAGLGRPRLVRRGRGDGQRHQRLRRSRLRCGAAAEHGAAVVATHIRLDPRVADPDPHYDDVVADVSRLPARARRSGPGPASRRAHRARRRPRPRQDRRAVAQPAPRLAGPGRARLSVAALRVQQDLSRHDARLE